jgi:hypothetical protein
MLRQDLVNAGERVHSCLHAMVGGGTAPAPFTGSSVVRWL